MADLWTGPDLLAALGRADDATIPSVSGISIDTRTLKPGDLFIALHGPNQDGHAYLGEAMAAGAGVALVAHANAGPGCGADAASAPPLSTLPPPNLPLSTRPLPTLPRIVVDDTQVGLEALGRAARARTAARIVAVTGSVGKTTTKEMLALVLARFGATHASTASYNNHWGVPLTLARMPRESAYGIFELGMNHAGEIAALTRQVRPHVAIITTIAPAHLAFFSSLSAIAAAKAEIFLGLMPDGVGILNRDHPLFDDLAHRARTAGVGRILSFGADPRADIRLHAYRPDGTGGLVDASIQGRPLCYRLAQPGRHLAENSLAVLAAIVALGLDPAMAAAAFEAMPGLAGRGAQCEIRVRTGTARLIDESYNANPASMMAAFAVLGATPPVGAGRRIAILGDMLELGPESETHHRTLALPLLQCGVDRVFACGTAMRALYDALPDAVRGGWSAHSSALLPAVLDTLQSGDVVMVKGSLGSRMAAIVSPLKAGAAAPLGPGCAPGIVQSPC